MLTLLSQEQKSGNARMKVQSSSASQPQHPINIKDFICYVIFSDDIISPAQIPLCGERCGREL